MNKTSILILYTNIQGIIFGVLVSFIIASNYSINIQGVYYLTTALVSWFILCEFGFSHSLLFIKNNDNLNGAFGFYILIYLILAITVLSYSYIINPHVYPIPSLVYIIAFIINTILSMGLSLYRSKGNEDNYWKVRSLEYTAYNIINLSLMMLGYGMLSLVVAIFTSLIINILFIIKNNIFNQIGFSFLKWKKYIFPIQIKSSFDYISAFIGIKPMLPMIADLLPISKIGKIGLSITLVTILISVILNIYVSAANRYKCNLNSKSKLIKSAFLCIVLYITLSIVTLSLYAIYRDILEERIVSLEEMIKLLLNGLFIISLSILSSYKRIFDNDKVWIFIILYNTIICLSIYFSLLYFKDFFKGFYYAFLIFTLMTSSLIIARKIYKK